MDCSHRLVVSSLPECITKTLYMKYLVNKVNIFFLNLKYNKDKLLSHSHADDKLEEQTESINASLRITLTHFIIVFHLVHV